MKTLCAHEHFVTSLGKWLEARSMWSMIWVAVMLGGGVIYLQASGENYSTYEPMCAKDSCLNSARLIHTLSTFGFCQGLVRLLSTKRCPGGCWQPVLGLAERSRPLAVWIQSFGVDQGSGGLQGDSPTSLSVGSPVGHMFLKTQRRLWMQLCELRSYLRYRLVCCLLENAVIFCLALSYKLHLFLHDNRTSFMGKFSYNVCC